MNQYKFLNILYIFHFYLFAINMQIHTVLRFLLRWMKKDKVGLFNIKRKLIDS